MNHETAPAPTDHDASQPSRAKNALTRRRKPGAISSLVAIILGVALGAIFFIAVGILGFLPKVEFRGQSGGHWWGYWGLLATIVATPFVAATPLYLVLRGQHRNDQGA